MDDYRDHKTKVEESFMGEIPWQIDDVAPMNPRSGKKKDKKGKKKQGMDTFSMHSQASK